MYNIIYRDYIYFDDCVFEADYKLIDISERILKNKTDDTFIHCPVLKIERTNAISRSLLQWILRKPIKYKIFVFSVIRYTDGWRNLKTYKHCSKQHIFDEIYKQYEFAKNLEDNA